MKVPEISWINTDHYLNTHLVKEDAALTAATASIQNTNLPRMEVSPTQGKFLYMLAKMNGAKRILELGTFYGYSTIWLAKALPEDGLIITMEMTERFVNIAQNNVEHAGLSHKVKFLHGDAVHLLNGLIRDKIEPFDMIFIDAHKPSYPLFLELALKLAKPGTVIIGDNVILDGELPNQDNQNPKVTAVRQFIEALSEEETLESTALQTVGIKGYDGFTISIVK